MKHSWLYLHGLETESEVRRLVAFYVEGHNDMMPHSGFDGQTPNEVFFRTGDAVVASLRRIGRTPRQSDCLDNFRCSAMGVTRPHCCGGG